MDPVSKCVIFCFGLVCSIYLTRKGFQESAGQAVPIEGCMVGGFCLVVLAALGALLIYL